jgi:outer membrane protein OmpA-like peptidoglycan-associated protein
MVQSEIIDHLALNEASLPAGASEKLDRLASQLNLYKEAKVHIDGRTDSSYTSEYNTVFGTEGTNRAGCPGIARY